MARMMGKLHRAPNPGQCSCCEDDFKWGRVIVRVGRRREKREWQREARLARLADRC